MESSRIGVPWALKTFGSFCVKVMMFGDTVDGRNPAPVEFGSLSDYLHRFLHPRWLAGFFPSTVSWGGVGFGVVTHLKLKVCP